MQTGSKYRLFSLLLALGMLLGLVATGCSDKDRDGSGKPTPEKKQIVFVYEKDGIGPKVLGKVPANADSIQATAIAADGSVIAGGAKLKTTVVDEQLEKDGKYHAYTAVATATDKVIYTFYYTEKDGKNVRAYACTLPSVAALQEGATVTEDEMIVADISAKCYNAAGQEQDTFQVGDTLQIKVTYVADDITKDITNDVTFTGYDEKVIKPSADALAGEFDALGEGTTAFDVEYQGIVFKAMGIVTVSNASEPTVVSLRVKSTEETVKMLETVQLEAEAVFSDDTTGPVPAELDIVWTSDNPEVATVDDTGLVTGEKSGTANIEVKSADGECACEQPCKVTVTALEKGDVFTLGKWYDKDGQLTEAITWKVMKIEEATETTPKRALVVAEKALDCQKYHQSRVDTTWAACSLRGWLTGSDAQGTGSTFYNNAFTEAEKAKIALTEHTTCDWGGTGTYGDATQDLVFLLDEAEAKDLYPSNAERKCQCTEYATKQGAYSSDDYCFWWLRSPGSLTTNAAFVRSDGDVGNYYVNDGLSAVRPALYIAL